MTLPELKAKIRADRSARDRAELLQLAEVGPMQVSMAWRLWEIHAPPKLVGILTGNGWKWDSTIQGYRSTDGKIVSGARLKKLALDVSDAIREDMRKRTLLPAFLTPNWRRDFGMLVAGSFILMGGLAAGGMYNLTPELSDLIVSGGVRTDGSRTPGSLAFSLARLARWGRQHENEQDEAEDGEEPESEGMSPDTRGDLYGASANIAFENVKRESHAEAKDDDGKLLFKFERNVLGPNENHCTPGKWTDGCQELTDAGWQPIGSMSAPGLRTCRAHCKCRMDYSLVGDALRSN